MKNKNPFWLLASAFLLMSAGGCYYDNLAELHPESLIDTGNCDTTAAVTFTGVVQPILNQSCGTGNSCHGTSNTSGIELKTYDGVKQQADNGKLWSSLTWDGNAALMPKNSTAKLDNCSLDKIQKWLEAGAPLN